MDKPEYPFVSSISILVIAAAAVAVLAAATLVGGAGWSIAIAGLAFALIAYGGYRRLVSRLAHHHRHGQEMSDLHLATIDALAFAIEARDEKGERHVHHMEVYAAGVARALGLSDLEIQGVRTASLLHDIGKLAVPEHILSKPGVLTQEEFQKIRVHPQVGAEIVADIPFPYPVAPLILAHHERWDGLGYPHGLAGNAIPLGARIIAIVDYFDALISDRSYQSSIPIADALSRLEQERGKAFDPAVVDAFIRLYPDLAREAEAVETRRKRRTSRERHPTQVQIGGPTAPSSSPSVFHDIAMAHKEIYALYELAKAMGSSFGVADTMALIAAKLKDLIPFSCCALFLDKDDSGAVSCRFAIGTDADRLVSLNVPAGAGLSGWVARHRRPLVNARPAADIEAAGGAAGSLSLQSALVCPLMFHDRLIGTLAVYHVDPSAYTDDHRPLLARISEQAGAVIHHSLVFERTQEDSLRDSLTGLPNRSNIIAHVGRELSRSQRLKADLSLIVMDLDGFKDINDTYGHHVGDRALQVVAAALQGTVRQYDLCARYAGDEFIVVLSGCGAAEAERKRLEFQKSVENVVFDPALEKHVPLALSAGASVFPHDGETFEALLAAADARMYRDKIRRKRQRMQTTGPDAGSVSEEVIKRAASGVL